MPNRIVPTTAPARGGAPARRPQAARAGWPGLLPRPERFGQVCRKPIDQGDTQALARLRSRMRPFLLRRTKEQVAAELPAKTEQVLSTELDAGHRRAYDQRLEPILAEGHRALVFSRFTRYLTGVREHLEARGMRTAYLDGSTADRQGVIDSFRSGQAEVFLISLKAGDSA